jgi:hypothetical protein
MLQGFINCHSIYPSSNLGSSRELADPPKYLEKHLLRQVRGILKAHHADH